MTVMQFLTLPINIPCFWPRLLSINLFLQLKLIQIPASALYSRIQHLGDHIPYLVHLPVFLLVQHHEYHWTYDLPKEISIKQKLEEAYGGSWNKEVWEGPRDRCGMWKNVQSKKDLKNHQKSHKKVNEIDALALYRQNCVEYLFCICICH